MKISSQLANNFDYCSAEWKKPISRKAAKHVLSEVEGGAKEREDNFNRREHKDRREVLGAKRPVKSHPLCVLGALGAMRLFSFDFLRVLGASALKIVADPSCGGSAV
jgi:hypothetical protein